MKCKHSKSIEQCGSCLKKVLSKCARGENCKCYVNAVILQPNSSSTVIRNLTSDEITNSDACVTIPLTTSCNGALQLQLGACKSPVDSWCKIVDSGNGFITSLQVPKGCCGCYNFELSASVTVTGTFNFTLFNLQGVAFLFSIDVNLSIRADLKLSEQIKRETNCVTDNVSTQQDSCFTSDIFPIIGLPMATQTLSQFDISSFAALIFSGGPVVFSTASSQLPAFSNLSTSGLVCLKDCQRLVPTITLHPLDLNRIINALIQLEIAFNQPVGSLFGPLTLSNVRLHLANLSLKLVRVGSCETECNSRYCR